MGTRSHILIIALLVFSTWPLAKAQASPQPELQKAIDLINEMEDAKAISYLEKALDKPGNTQAEQAEVYLYLGIAHYNLGDENAAGINMKKAKELNAGIKLPDGSSPKMMEFFNAAGQSGHEATSSANSSPMTLPESQSSVASENVTKTDEAGSTTAINWPAWITLGSGVAVGVTGIIFGALSRADLDRANDLNTFTSEAEDYHDSASSKSTAANILWGVSGAAIITSGVLFYLSHKSAKQSQLRAFLGFSAQGGMLMLKGQL